jgi:thymidylate synthase
MTGDNMRIYSDVLEMTRETSRELKELGITVPISHMQDKNVAGDEKFFTKELIGYSFKVSDPTSKHNEMVEFVYRNNPSEGERVKSFINQEFEDRFGGYPVNPGNSYAKRLNMWTEFLESDGRFSYQYAERINDRDLWQPQSQTVIDELKAHPDSRQGIIQIFNYSKDNKNIGGRHRIPCSMHYQFLVRNSKVHSCYVMRSNDFYGHFTIDIILAARMQMHIAEKTGYDVGSLTYFSGSLHAYQKDFNELIF